MASEQYGSYEVYGSQYGEHTIHDPWAEAAREYHRENIEKAIFPLRIQINQLLEENSRLKVENAKLKTILRNINKERKE